MSCFEDNEKMREYREEGPSSYMYNDDHMNHVDVGMRNSYLEGSKRVEHLERDRIELLTKLEELNNQLRHSGSVSGTTRGKGILGRELIHNEPFGIADAWIANDFPDPDMRKTSKETWLNDTTHGGHSYNLNHRDSHPSANRHGPYMQNSYHHPYIQDDRKRYGSFDSQMPRRNETSGESQYVRHPKFPLYHPGQHVRADSDTFKPYQHNALSHHPACSCFQCYNTHQSTSPSAAHSNFPSGTYADVPSSRVVYHHNHDSRVTRGSSSFLDTTAGTSRDDDFNTRVGINENLQTRRLDFSKGSRRCYPLVGGAPFITCHTCYEVLQLPTKLPKVEDRQNKLQCGACSTLIYYYFQQNKLLVSEDIELKNDSATSEVMDGEFLRNVGPGNQTGVKLSSNDFDSIGNDFKLSEEHALRDTYQTSSVSPSSTEGKCSQLNLKSLRNLQNSTSPPPGSSLQELFDYSSSKQKINQDGKGNQSSQSDHEKVIPKVVFTVDHNSLKEVSIATEMDVSFNGYSTSGISQDSGNGSTEYQNSQVNKKDGYAGTVNKSFKEVIKQDEGIEGDKSCVTINGYPISDQIIKKAEKRAGRIQPGNYWYDIRAGFWGVMGGPCLGIIPPLIQDFNYPLPEDCSGGMTGVFVNGRELHEKDLQLLSGRGLPTTRDRSYVIEISGRVLDADSGKELDSLGRLASSVQKARRGFGMKPPKEIVVNIEQ